MNILYVCTGNINRSASAEVLTNALFNSPEIFSDSCGVKQKIGKNIMAKRMRESVTRLVGDGWEPTRSKRITQGLVDWADHIVYFQPSHKEKMVAEFGDSPKYKALYECLNIDNIPDPNFNTDPNYCDGVRDMIIMGIKTFIREYRGP